MITYDPKKYKSFTHSADLYAKAVLSGEVPACRFVKLAAKRHLEDRMRDDIWFDEAAADKVIEFFSYLQHTKGREWAGQPFVLEGWEVFIVSCIFGWKRADGYRRFRTIYIQVARKNGKSTLIAAILLYLLVADGEPGAEVYTAATKRDQAIIVFNEAVNMRNKSPALRKRIGKFKNNLHIDATASKLEPLGADADTMDGLNVHAAGVDELHAHKTRAVWDVLETATGARTQPLLIGITTAGFNQNGICFEQYEYVSQILKGAVADDTYFGIIFTLDLKKDWPDLQTAKEHAEDPNGTAEDDWTDPANWPKANPNLGVSVYLDDLERKAAKAAQIPGAVNNFLTKHMDVWTQQATRWIDLALWDQNFTKEIYEMEG